MAERRDERGREITLRAEASRVGFRVERTDAGIFTLTDVRAAWPMWESLTLDEVETRLEELGPHQSGSSETG